MDEPEVSVGVSVMATSAYLSPGPPPLSDQEEGGVMNLVNPAVTSQSYAVPREQVVSNNISGGKN